MQQAIDDLGGAPKCLVSPLGSSPYTAHSTVCERMPKTMTNWMPTHVQIIYAIQTDFVDLGIEPGCAGRASLIPSYYCIYPVTDEIKRPVSVDRYREFQPPPRSPYSFTKP